MRDSRLRDASNVDAGEYEPPAVTPIGSVDAVTRGLFDASSLSQDDLTNQ